VLHDNCVVTSLTQPTGFTKSKPDGQRIVGKEVGTAVGEEGAGDGTRLGFSDGVALGAYVGFEVGTTDGD
jgi:hypothetical protein